MFETIAYRLRFTNDRKVILVIPFQRLYNYLMSWLQITNTSNGCQHNQQWIQETRRNNFDRKDFGIFEIESVFGE